MGQAVRKRVVARGRPSEWDQVLVRELYLDQEPNVDEYEGVKFEDEGSNRNTRSETNSMGSRTSPKLLLRDHEPRFEFQPLKARGVASSETLEVWNDFRMMTG